MIERWEISWEYPDEIKWNKCKCPKYWFDTPELQFSTYFSLVSSSCSSVFACVSDALTKLASG